MSRGVFAGATIECHPTTSKPGYVSDTVGQSGTSGLRFSDVTPSDFNFPPLTCAIADPMSPTLKSTVPLIVSTTDGGMPLYGTTRTSKPPMRSSCAIATCALEEPAPADT